MSFTNFSKFLAVVCVGIWTGDLFAQSSSVRQAEKKISQGNWAAARQILVKALKKDTINPEVEVALSKWYLADSNPNQQLDTAYRYNLKASHHIALLTPKQKEKLKRDLVDSAAVVEQRSIIESASFEKAKQINSEKSYSDYLKRYTFSKHRLAATELRDEAAFLDALRQNSYSGFENYISKYPQSHRVAEAKARYEKLLFESRTHDRKLKSYLGFVKEFPKSPYKLEAEKNIFEVETSSGSPSDLMKFIRDNTESRYTNSARNILFHQLREMEEKLPSELLTDSLREVIEEDRLMWAPFYKNAMYGFIDSDGNETLAAQFENIDESYKCGSVDTDILMTNKGLVSRSGKSLSKAKIFKDLGFGFVKVTDTCQDILHKSGALVRSCVEDASVLGGRYLTITKNRKVGLIALNGREITKPLWSSIGMIEDVIVFDRGGKKILSTQAQLQLVADGNPLDESFVVDEVKSIGKNRLLVHNGSLEGVVNSNLEFIIPFAIQQLLSTPLGLLRKINDQYIFSDVEALKNESWDRYAIHRQWLLLRNKTKEKLLDTHSKKVVESNPDSLWFEKGLAFALHDDSVRIHLSSVQEIDVHVDSKIFFIKSPDSIRYFFVQQKNKKNIFSIESGKKMFTTEFDQIESLNSEYFMVSKKNKKGIINLTGKVVLPVEYDILVMNGNHVSLYKDKKFGLYNCLNNQMIKPMFERNVVPLDSNALVTFQRGHYGLIDWSGKPISAFEYDEIRSWGSNLIWVRKDAEWTLLDYLVTKKIVTRIRNFDVIKNTPEEKIAIVKQENLLGIASSTRGIIIPPAFSFLMNLGSEDEPFYFTSKEVEEAGIVAVIYYDKNGKLLRKQVYEDEEYARIACPQD